MSWNLETFGQHSYDTIELKCICCGFRHRVRVCRTSLSGQQHDSHASNDNENMRERNRRKDYIPQRFSTDTQCAGEMDNGNGQLIVSNGMMMRTCIGLNQGDVSMFSRLMTVNHWPYQLPDIAGSFADWRLIPMTCTSCQVNKDIGGNVSSNERSMVWNGRLDVQMAGCGVESSSSTIDDADICMDVCHEISDLFPRTYTDFIGGELRSVVRNEQQRPVLHRCLGLTSLIIWPRRRNQTHGHHLKDNCYAQLMSSTNHPGSRVYYRFYRCFDDKLPHLDVVALD